VTVTGAQEQAGTHADTHGPVPWRGLLPVLVPVSLLLAAIFAAQSMTRSTSTLRVLDNAHWTLAEVAAAALGWIAVRHGPPARRMPLLCYAVGLTGYAVGQLCWDAQVASGWNPFPGPADIFYLMLGLFFAIGLAFELWTPSDTRQRRIVVLDAGMSSVAMLTMVLAFYLPLRGEQSVLQLSVLAAYPFGLLTSACLVAIALPSLRLRADTGWALFAGSLALNGGLWMKWNAMTLSSQTADGTFLNACFSVAGLALGVGVARWVPTPVANHRWERRYEGLLRLLPLAAVVGASLAVIMAFTIAQVAHAVRDSIAFGAGAVLMLAFARQSVLLHERDRMIEMEGQFRTLFDTAPDAILLMDSERILNCNASAERLFGIPAPELLGKGPAELSPEMQPDGSTSRDQAIARISAALSGTPQSFEWRHLRAGSAPFQAEVSLHSVDLPGRTLLQAVVRDVTDRCEAEAKHLRLEEQLRQASRMEAVGRLAGGVAHDFNNILTVILGTSEIGLMRLPPGDRMRRELEEIRKSAQRAAALTAQLLAFSRKQVIAPVPSNLNTLVRGAMGMLRRLIGEDVELELELAEPLETVLIDRTQFDQMLVNLSVNARDAMPRGGRLVISTGMAEFRPSDVGEASSIRPGRFVRLEVADDGAGIPPELIEHIFEPFFTTKELGRGTGLGLSTVYGIVRQSRGFIDLESQPGEGTRFSLYFPAVSAEPLAALPPSMQPMPRGVESILLVEDDALVRELAHRMLADLGYHVHVASGGEEALMLVASPAVRVDLLLTDVIMPGMSGKETYERLTASRPGLRVVYTSGYTANILATHGVLEQDISLLQKPFSIGELATIVRGALDRPAAGTTATRT